MKVLISPISADEAKVAYAGGADIIDIKNVKEGSLGASFPHVIRGTIDSVNDPRVVFSATLGDLPFKPGTASLAALGAAVSGARYIKAGLYGIKTRQEAFEVMSAVARACRDYDPSIVVVAAGYADHRRFGGLDHMTLVQAAADARCDLVMVDTAIKDGKSLFDAMSVGEIRDFVAAGQRAGMKVALAGSIGAQHLQTVFDSGADVVGVRGAVCNGADRTTGIQLERVKSFMSQVRALKATDPMLLTGS